MSVRVLPGRAQGLTEGFFAREVGKAGRTVYGSMPIGRQGIWGKVLLKPRGYRFAGRSGFSGLGSCIYYTGLEHEGGRRGGLVGPKAGLAHRHCWAKSSRGQGTWNACWFHTEG